jgi:hypothetical protein
LIWLDQYSGNLPIRREIFFSLFSSRNFLIEVFFAIQVICDWWVVSRAETVFYHLLVHLVDLDQFRDTLKKIKNQFIPFVDGRSSALVDIFWEKVAYKGSGVMRESRSQWVRQVVEESSLGEKMVRREESEVRRVWARSENLGYSAIKHIVEPGESTWDEQSWGGKRGRWTESEVRRK